MTNEKKDFDTNLTYAQWNPFFHSLQKDIDQVRSTSSGWTGGEVIDLVNNDYSVLTNPNATNPKVIFLELKRPIQSSIFGFATSEGNFSNTKITATIGLGVDVGAGVSVGIGVVAVGEGVGVIGAGVTVGVGCAVAVGVPGVGVSVDPPSQAAIISMIHSKTKLIPILTSHELSFLGIAALHLVEHPLL